jgi:hypothetical protein
LHKYWDALKPLVLYPQMSSYSLFRQTAVWLTIAVLIEKIAGPTQSAAIFRRFAGFILLARGIPIISTWISISQIRGMVLAYGQWRVLRRWPRVPIVAAAILLCAYVTVFRLEPFELADFGGHYGWMPFLSFMKGSIDRPVWVSHRSGIAGPASR